MDMTSKKRKVIDAIRAAVLESNIPAMTPEGQATARDEPELTDDDPEGMNDDRAEWAAAALKAFRRVTRTEPKDALKDLLCDLAHWCDREGKRLGVSFDVALDSAMWAYREEAPNGKQFEGVETLGVDEGPEQEPDEDDCDCAERSWYGPQHDTACPLAGRDRNITYTEDEKRRIEASDFLRDRAKGGGK